jgi:hypothetical protein
MTPCVSCVAAEPGSTDSAVPIRTLAKGAFSAHLSMTNAIFRDDTSWKKFWNQHTSKITPAEPAPAVDFSKEMVIAVTQGQQRTGGYSIEIKRAEIKEKNLQITVERKSPPKGAMTIQSLTAPFHYVAIPRSELKVTFVTNSIDHKR